ncbi:fibronectin type III domain-containing protein [Nocardioides speluncae]|uniref:fibronectin type III domain-containing protein n=1 Tax=Nocardioides speluncae TaxID=2670337 RepID=UPI0012B16164|nr:fibronectin type III domain-containing protein [Nocardioides speluncae]
MSVTCGLAFAAGALGVAQSYGGTPEQGAGATSAPAAAPRAAKPDPGAAPVAQVAGVAAALDISRAEARERLQDQDAAHATYKRLPESVHEDLAGHWFDAESGKLAVAVTSGAAAEQARAAGAEAKVVERSQAELDRLVAQVRKAAGKRMPGLKSFGVDLVSNSVSVAINRNAKTAATERFIKRVRALPGVRVVESEGAPLQQADLLNGAGWNRGQTNNNCSVGFNATGTGGSKHYLTAGHCTATGTTAYSEVGQVKIGNVNGSFNNREGDFGKVDVTEASWTLKPEVNTWGTGSNIIVSGSAEAMVGEAVCHSGRTDPKWECGKVTKVNQTVEYSGGLVIEGLTFTDSCSQGGDSGGSWLVGTKAVGLHEGGLNGNSCPAGDNAIFQPVNEALQKWNLTLLTGGGGDDTQAPTAPSGLRSTGTTANSVSLSWTASTDNVGVTAYDVYNGSALATTVTGTSATVSGLTANTDYTFTVKARDAAGNTSAASSSVTARTQTGDPGGDDEPPTTPGGLRSTGVTSTSVSLSWDASVDNVGVSGYDVFRGTTLATSSTSTSATVTGLTPNTDYSFTVQAKDAAGNKSKPTRAVIVRTSGDGGGERTFSNETDYPIRDFQVTTSNVSSTADGAAATPVTVKVTATHTCQEDLQIGVRSPSGRYYQLKAYGDNNWNCTPFASTRTFTFTPTASEVARGTWQLRIGDNGPGDTGVLSGWSITV